MNIGVIGLGSMGKRRIRLLKNLEQCGSIIGIDSREDRRIEAEEAFKISTECDLASAIKIHNLKALVVSTAPLSHAAIIKEGLKHKCHIFTEINLVATGYENNIKRTSIHKRDRFICANTCELYIPCGTVSADVAYI